MKKNELFQIGEVSKLFHISISTLRYYDRAGLVRPEYTDPESGYRYYSTRQFEYLNTIRYLRALDMPLDEIAAFLRNRNIRSIRESLLKQREAVKRQLMELHLIERKISNRLNQIEDALASELDVIRIENYPPRRMASIRKNLLPQDAGTLEYSIRLLEEAEESTVTFLGKVGIGLSKEKLEAGRFKPYDMVFIILDEEDRFKGPTVLLPAETCATLRFRGVHEQAFHYYEKMMKYIREHHYRVAGFSKEITMIDYGLTNDTEEFVTEIQIPVMEEKEDERANGYL